MHEWQKVANDTYRLVVPGGWIYLIEPRGGMRDAMAAVFVPARRVDGADSPVEGPVRYFGEVPL